jgi:hypothetical protein
MAGRLAAAARLAAAGLLVVLGGCSEAGIKTYPVQGNVELTGGDTKLLTGSFVEFVLDSDPLVRSSGKITPEGRFTLETIHAGQVVKGVREGTYKAQIVLADEDDEGVPKGRGKNPIHKRFCDYKTSGLSFTVPAKGEVTVSVSKS